MHKIINYILVGLLLLYIIVSFTLNINNDTPYITVALVLIIVSFIIERKKVHKN